jgi:hypothetical protein
MWHVDPLLGNDCETNEITAISRQQLRKYATVMEPFLGSGPRSNGNTVEAGFLCGQLRSYITRPTEFSSVCAVQYSGVERVSWRVSELEDCCGSVLVSCCC